MAACQCWYLWHGWQVLYKSNNCQCFIWSVRSFTRWIGNSSTKICSFTLLLSLHLFHEKCSVRRSVVRTVTYIWRILHSRTFSNLSGSVRHNCCIFRDISDAFGVSALFSHKLWCGWRRRKLDKRPATDIEVDISEEQAKIREVYAAVDWQLTIQIVRQTVTIFLVLLLCMENFHLHYFFHTCAIKSSISSKNSLGFSIAAKCPPLVCTRDQTRLPVFATQLTGIGASSSGKYE